jgi:uncharacterized membrane protein YfcA
MNISAFLITAIFLISLVLKMVGLGGGLIFSPLFVILGFAKAEAASASLFLNLIAAGSAAYTYARKKMVDFSLSIPLIISMSSMLKGKSIRVIFSIILVVLCAKLLHQSVFGQ